jgi:L-ascorbate metabolism protein UlaG (beta-lactamase superfamily)
VPFIGKRLANMRQKFDVPPGHVIGQADALAAWHGLDSRDAIAWLGHASFLIRINGRTILTDPYLGKVAGPNGFGPQRFIAPAIAPKDLPRIDVIALSHNHYDHLCDWTLGQLADRAHHIDVVCPLGLKPSFTRHGFARVHELDWEQRVDLGGIGVTVLPAIHFSGRGAFDRNRTLWASFSFEAEGAKIYFAGDSGHGPVFRQIGAAHGPFDLAIVGIGAYEPTAIMRAVHTNPEEGLELALDVGAHVALGMHWGTIALTDEPMFEPPVRFKAAALARGLDPDRAWIMAIGETRALPRRFPRN